MTRFYYAADSDTQTRATFSGVNAFRSMTLRDEFVDSKPKGFAITRSVADTACLRAHKCTAHEAQQRGFI